MDLEEYESFMHSISESAGRVGLNSYNLYSDTCEQSQVDKWVISVSWKTSLDSWYILCSEDDPENLVRRFNYPFVVGTKEEIESYLRKAETVGAECFSKQSTAWNGFIQPSPQFMELSRVEQAEYAFHESYHSTKKCFLGWEVQHLPSGSEEEARAFVAGHLSMVNYFNSVIPYQSVTGGSLQSFFYL